MPLPPERASPSLPNRPHVLQNGQIPFNLLSFSSGSKAAYREALGPIQIEGRYLDAAYSIQGSRVIEWLDEPGFAITGVVNSQKDGKPLVTVHYENSGLTVDDEPVSAAGWFSVRPDDCWALDEYELRTQWGEEPRTVSKACVEYGPKQHGFPVLRCVRAQVLRDDGRDTRITITVKTIDFGPAPDEEFQLAAFGLEPPQEPVAPFTRAFRFTLWALGSVALMLVVTVALQVVRKAA